MRKPGSGSSGVDIPSYQNLLGHEIATEAELVALAGALGAASVRGLSSVESGLLRSAPRIASDAIQRTNELILLGADPLGVLFCSLRSAVTRRAMGATFTPAPIVSAMVEWAHANATPERVVDAGAGSGRFAVTTGKAFPNAQIVAVEIDPVAALIARANLAATGLANRASVILDDYRLLRLPSVPGQTLFIGNPPYVRHHLIDRGTKKWLSQTAEELGYRASQLAGLHIHFFLATLQQAKPGDVGVFVTAAEWMDVNYGRLLRELFVGHLGGLSIHLVDPKALPFADAATTAAITTFQVGYKSPNVRILQVQSAEDLRSLEGGRQVARERLAKASRWSVFTRARREIPQGYVELGELCSVHRGQVTGANRVWIAGDHSAGLPESVYVRAVTRAKDLLQAGTHLLDTDRLRRVIDLPADLDLLSAEERRSVESFLARARLLGADKGYIATHRKPWWSVRLHHPAPILMTYMARRAPAFVVNTAGARHINIAHGLYPRVHMTDSTIEALASILRGSTSVADGRTYAGGLTKFEPKEVEHLFVPDLATLEAMGRELPKPDVDLLLSPSPSLTSRASTNL